MSSEVQATKKTRIRRSPEMIAELIWEAERKNNTAEICRRENIVPTLFYRWKSKFKESGIHGLKAMKRGPNPYNFEFRYAIVTTVEDANGITEYHDTAILPGDRLALYGHIIEEAEDFARQREERRTGVEQSYDIPGISYQFVNDSAKQMPGGDVSGILAEGKKRQIANFQEVLAAVYPDYATRRKWTREQITELYQHTMATANDTPYVKVRQNLTDGSSVLIGTFGVNQANYQKVRFFNKVTQKWTEVVGNPEIGWHSPIPILGMEDIKGYPFTLDRPVVLDHVVMPSSEPYSDFKGTLAPGMVPDTTRGIFYFKGQISEPTKLWLKKDSVLREEAYQKIWKFMADAAFPEWRSSVFNLKGSRLYTYNPAREWPILLGKKGFTPVKSIPPMTIDGKRWDVLYVSYKDIVESLAKGNAAMAKQLLDNFLKNVNK